LQDRTHFKSYIHDVHPSQFNCFRNPSTSIGTSRERRYGGFSLIELLAVISIIAVLAVVVVFGLQGGGRGFTVGQAVDQAASVVEQARMEAMSLRLGAKLIIDNDSGSDDRLRRMAVLKPHVNPSDGQQDGWRLGTRPLALPDGVYLLENYSGGFIENERYDFRSGDTQDGTSGIRCLVLEFDRAGRLVGSEGARMVFSRALEAGALPPPDMLAGRQGFVVRKYGAPAFFQKPEQMTPSAQP